MSKMEMIYIRELEITGFGSIASLKYQFGIHGLKLLSGENGAGKSTIFAALFWCLYGQLLKKDSSIEPWPTVKEAQGFKGTAIRLKLNKGDENIEIIRCKGYKGKIHGTTGGDGLFILTGGKDTNTKGKVDRQKQINQWIGYTPDLFRHVVMFPQEAVRLMEESGPDKKKVFEEAFEAAFISRARIKAEKEIEVISHTLREYQLKVENLNELVKSSKNELDRYKEAESNFEKEKQKDLARINKGLKELAESKKEVPDLTHEKTELKNIEKFLEASSDLENSQIPARELKASFEIKQLESEKERLERDIQITKEKFTSKKCSLCGQPLPKGESIAQQKKLIAEIRGRIVPLVVEIEKKKEEYQKIKKILKSEEKRRNQINESEKRKKILERNINDACEIKNYNKGIKLQMKSLTEEAQRVVNRKFTISISEIENGLKNLESKLGEMESKFKKVNKKYGVYKWLLNDPLSNSGLKAFIFDSALKKLNNQLLKYDNIIGFNIQVIVDLESARKDIKIIITKKGDMALYEDLSKGQKQLTNIALVFALNDVISKVKPINILLIDEAFESLSHNNVEKVGDIIANKAKHKDVHLITHLTTFNPISAKKITLYLNNQGITEIAN